MRQAEICSLLKQGFHTNGQPHTEWVQPWLEKGVDAVAVIQNDGTVIAQWSPNDNCHLQRPVDEASYQEPLYISGELVAMLCIYGEISSDDRQHLHADANLLSMILTLEHNVEIMTIDMIEQQDQMLALHQIAQTAHGHSTLEQSMLILSRIAARSLHTEYGFLLLVRPGDDHRMVCYPEYASHTPSWLNLVEHLDTPKSEELWHLTTNDDCLRDIAPELENAQIRKVKIRHGTYFYFGIANKQSGPFRGPDFKLFYTITSAAAAIVANTIHHEDTLQRARIQAEVELATKVQMSLLPQTPPAISGLEIAAKSIPATEVGGDFFDFSVNGNIFSFCLGDVSGKGMGAALFMAMLRTVLRGKTTELAGRPAPGEVLKHANSLLYSDFSEVGMFATVFQGQYDISNHVLFYANDGHAPVIYRPRRGRSRMIEADNPPLGIMPDHDRAFHSLLIMPGDVVVIASDGLTEAEGAGQTLYGYEQLLTLIDECADFSANKILEIIFESINDFSKQPIQSDDQTLIVLKRSNLRGN